MSYRYVVIAIALIGLLGPVPASTAERAKAQGSTSLRPPAPLDTAAMNAMLRADTDKDGTLRPDELANYDMGLARRFKDMDSDRDGKLTWYEFEKLLAQPDVAASSR